MTIEANDETFEQDVLRADKPVLVDFYADWCAPCKAMTPVLDAYAAQKADTLKTVKVNVETATAVKSLYNIRSLPTLIVFKNGAPIAQTSGAKNPTQLNFFVESALSQPDGKTLNLDAATKSKDKEEEQEVRRIGGRTVKASALVQIATGLGEVLGGGILAAASGGLMAIPCAALCAHGGVQMTGAIKAYQQADAIIEAGIQAANNTPNDTIEQKKARQDAFNKKWNAHFGPAFLQSKTAKLAVAGLQMFAGIALLCVFPAGAIAGLAGGLIALGGFSGVKEVGDFIGKLGQPKKQTQASDTTPTHERNCKAGAPDMAPKPASSLSDKAIGAAFDDVAQKSAPANENAQASSAPQQQEKRYNAPKTGK